MSKQSIFRIATIIAILTVLSKLAGFARDLVIAQAYGASITSDAYFYAYQVISLSLILLGGLGGPFHSATIAVFGKKKLTKSDPFPEKENTLFNAYLTYTIIGFSFITILVAIFALPITKCITAEATPELQALSAHLLVIMSPVILMGGVIGLLYGFLNVYDEFFWPSISPLIHSMGIIVFVLLSSKSNGAMALAYGTLIGSFIMLLTQFPGVASKGYKFAFNFNYKLPGLKQIGEILFPAMIGTTVGQINIYVDMFFVSGLEAGGWTAIVYANRLIQLPIGVLLTALIVPIFPLLNKFVADNDMENLRKYSHSTIISLWLLSFPITVFTLLFSYDGVRVLLQRGAFTSKDTALVSYALFWLTFSVIPYMARDGITRIFYAFDDSKTPLTVGLFSIVVHAVLNWILVKPMGMGVAGITLSTALCTIVNMVLLTILIRKKVKDIGLRRIIRPTSIMILASILMGILCYLLNLVWMKYIPDTQIYVFTKLCFLFIVGSGFYFLITILLGLTESKMLWNRSLAVVRSKI